MFHQDPQQRLWLINERNAELIHAAEQHRLARAQRGGPADHFRARILDHLRAGLGRASAVIRRGLSSPEAPCDDSAQTAHPA